MSKKQLTYTMWVEKYRPSSIKGILLPPSIKKFFVNLVKEKEIPNLLFYSSSPGVGKTTVAKALANDIGSDSIYINMSLESGIDTLRTRISKFATSYTMFGDYKEGKRICILDEFDGSTPSLQAAMRGFMEEFQDNCRFILTCNYATKIIEPLKSRCQMVDFNMTTANAKLSLTPIILKRVIRILKEENVEFDLETVEKIVNTFYPDIRKMINVLQQYSKINGMIDPNILEMEKVDNEFYQMILDKKLMKARKYVIERNYNYDEMYRNLFDGLVPLLDNSSKSAVILIIAEMMYQSAFAIDKEITFASCLIQIMENI